MGPRAKEFHGKAMMKDLFSLNGRVVLVTGAAQGLGRAIAEACAAHGADLVLTDRNDAGLSDTVESLRARGSAVYEEVADMQRAEDIARLIEHAFAWRGRIDTLVCNAGIQGPACSLSEISDEDWQRVFEINLHSAVRLCGRVAPRMATAGGGSLVLMSSLSALRGNKSIGLYALSKAALAQLARNLAVEWGPRNVRANAIAPGLIRTALAAPLEADQAFMLRRMQATPLRRMGDPHEIAGLVVLLASRAGAFITGQTLVADGGTLISDGS
jgi:NAD(P)-dependent dehydrogenase (short-subunit alcohol dehydrogenase family)